MCLGGANTWLQQRHAHDREQRGSHPQDAVPVSLNARRVMPGVGHLSSCNGKLMNIRLLRTSENDVDFVLSAEQSAENRSLVSQWARARHLAALTSEDLSHLIIENIADGSRVGYIILAGLADANQSIEFRRIVVTEKGRGYGKEALRMVKKLAFEELKAHRLWLDVKEHNVRARHVYESEGFVAEGVLRECVKTEAGFESLVVMSMLRGEYCDAQQGATPDRPKSPSHQS